MATQIAGLNYYELDFDADGTMKSDGGLPAAVQAPGMRDVFMLSHGWNSSADSARSMYQAMFTLLAGMIPERIGTSIAVGILWPSLLFPDDDPHTAPAVPSTGPQLAAALAPAFPEQQEEVARLGQLLDQQPQDAAMLMEFHSLASGLVTSPSLAPEDSGEQAAITSDTATVFGHAAAMSKTPAGNAEGIPNPVTSLWNGAREVLRTMSYYEMKNRAGVIGRNGLGPLVGELAATHPGIRVHLMGHSFGAKLLTSAVYATDDIPGVSQPVVTTLILFQGAFSQFSFSHNIPGRPGVAGFYTKVVEQGLVATPVTAIYSTRDLANSLLYPVGMAPVLEQFIFRDGDPPDDSSGYRISDDLRGAIGANGVQGFDMPQMGFVALPWPEDLDQSKLTAVRCINVNRSLVVSNMPDPLIGTHNDYTELEIFQAALKVSLLKRGE